jgi:hypothetical protein
MFISKTALAGAMALALAGGLHAEEKHLTLDDIDTLARQKIVDSMKKTPDGNASQQATPMLGASLPAAPVPAQAAAEAPKPVPRRATAPVAHAIPVTFLGAFNDSTGSYVLYDYMGAIYPGRQGTKLLNGWTVSRIKGYQVTVTEGKRSWSQVIVAQAIPVVEPSPSSSSMQALNDLNSPLPSAPGGNSVFIPTGK